LSEKHQAQPFWRFCTLGLWIVIFHVGLLPSETYLRLRWAAGVVPQHALVNSEFVLYGLLVVFFGWFIYHRCIEAGLSAARSQMKATIYAGIALVAFAPVPMDGFRDYVRIPVAADRYLVLSVYFAKILCWIHLLGLMFRYYLFSGQVVFAPQQEERPEEASK